ncbi:chitinase 10 [Malania oleifera]|uniref:chitinase 10 n=1 Tax=Malania oleifera TaxID=397392 RepID=UPI0025AE2A41|nr:chitinase 10 [Malania oleifera]
MRTHMASSPSSSSSSNSPFLLPLSLLLLLLLLLLLISSSSSTAVNGRGGGGGASCVISREMFNAIFLHKDDVACPARGFYSYESFVAACRDFPAFAGVGTIWIRRREVAAFLAQISHETTGGWPTAPDGPYSWGLCFKEEVSPQSRYCDASDTQWPCRPGRSYHGRGPIQLSWNFNYGPAGKALGFDGLGSPEVVSNNSVTSFKTALWFWMTERRPKPSCHDVMIGRYRPSKADLEANRTAGFGLVTNIINGGLECGKPNDERVNDRIGYFRRYAQLFNVTTGPNLDCQNQKSF